jgi:hypothetical protein
MRKTSPESVRISPRAESTVEAPFLCSFSMPFTTYSIALGVVVFLGVGELLFVIALCLSGSNPFWSSPILAGRFPERQGLCSVPVVSSRFRLPSVCPEVQLLLLTGSRRSTLKRHYHRLPFFV